MGNTITLAPGPTTIDDGCLVSYIIPPQQSAGLMLLGLSIGMVLVVGFYLTESKTLRKFITLAIAMAIVLMIVSALLSPWSAFAVSMMKLTNGLILGSISVLAGLGARKMVDYVYKRTHKNIDADSTAAGTEDDADSVSENIDSTVVYEKSDDVKKAEIVAMDAFKTDSDEDFIK